MNSFALKRKGPEPIASRTCWNGSVRASRSGMMKAGLFETWPSALNSSGKGFFSRKRMRRSSTTSSASTTVSSFWPKGLRFIQRVSEGTTSCARTGSPSWNLRPGRSVIVTTLPPSSVTWPSAICGCGAKLASSPYRLS